MQKLYVILDSDFGERLRTTDFRPIWIVMSPTNKPVVRSIWTTNPESDHTKGITGFTYLENLTPEETFLTEMNTIDLHHGPYSADPPYTILEVIGAHLNGRIKSVLSELGFVNFEEKEEGFTASRSLDEARKLRE